MSSNNLLDHKDMTDENIKLMGGCTCRQIRYQLTARPLIVHCCHCSWCQRETGSAFAVNAVIECDHVEITEGTVEIINTPSASGRGQKIARCPKCQVAVWSHYSGSGNSIHFIRGGTLDNPEECPPEIHIYTTTKQPWVILPEGIPAKKNFYTKEKYWHKASLKRLEEFRQRQKIKRKVS